MPKRHEMPVSESLAANRPRRKASLGAAARVALAASAEAEEEDDDDCLIIPREFLSNLIICTNWHLS